MQTSIYKHVLPLIKIKRPISRHYPFLLPVIRRVKIAVKSREYLNKKYKLVKSEDFKNFKIYQSQSLLRRKLGFSDPSLQEAKIHNLKLAIPHFTNVVIRPGQIFSLWNLLGEPTYKKGYIDGMLLSEGNIIKGVGGGLCQIANLIHWLFLHTPLEIKEHWHHDYDVFPDSGRTLPFGSGAGVLYNYFDLQYLNPTRQTFTLNVYLTPKHLHGEVWSDTEQKIKFSIVEEDHHFFRVDEQVFRENKLYKLIIDKKSGKTINKSLIKYNRSKVLYPVDDV